MVSIAHDKKTIIGQNYLMHEVKGLRHVYLDKFDFTFHLNYFNQFFEFK